MKLGYLILLLFPLCASAEVYKCNEKGKTIYSDAPCGDSAEVVELRSLEKTGTQLTTDSMEALSEDLQKDRKTRELNKDVEDQHRKIEKIEEHYQRDINKLNDQLADHRNKKDYKLWRTHPDKKKSYYAKEREIQNKISSTKLKYKSDKRLAYDKLYELKRQQRRYR